jgi:hypothetical protein
MNKSDNIILSFEIKKLKERLKKEFYDKLIISDTLLNLLSQYNMSYFLIFDIEEYYSFVPPRSSLRHDFCSNKLFIFDTNSKTILYYNYNIEKHFAELLSNNTPHVKSLLKKFEIH